MIFTYSIDDIIFENRNKAYGAYVLRRIYDKNLVLSAFYTTILFLLLFSIPAIYSYFYPSGLTIFPKDVIVISTFSPTPKENIQVPLASSSKPKEASPSVSNTNKYLPMVVSPDSNADPEVTKNNEFVDSNSGEGNNSEDHLAAGIGFPTDKRVELEKEDVPDEPFITVEEMPEFPGGFAELAKFIRNNVSYPKEANNMGIGGRVFLSFIVTASGEIKDVKVEKGIGFGCDEEALKVISKMPNWKAGKQNGRAVNVRMALPISFLLSQ